MVGAQLLKISNPTGVTGTGLPAQGTSFIFPEGQIGNITLNQNDFRSSAVNSASGSTPGNKAKIIGCSVVSNASWLTVTAAQITAGVVVELGFLDNDGYFTSFVSSY